MSDWGLASRFLPCFLPVDGTQAVINIRDPFHDLRFYSSIYSRNDETSERAPGSVPLSYERADTRVCRFALATGFPCISFHEANDARANAAM